MCYAKLVLIIITLVPGCFRYWAVAVPVYGMVLIITLLFLYVCYSMVLTPPLTDSRILTGM